jgi:hypothetical protein
MMTSSETTNIFTVGGYFDEKLELTHHGNGITITIEEPLAGNSITAFGKECSIRITYDDAVKLANWLLVTVYNGKEQQDIERANTPIEPDPDPAVAAYMKMALEAEQQGNTDLAAGARWQAEQAKLSKPKL